MDFLASAYAGALLSSIYLLRPEDPVLPGGNASPAVFHLIWGAPGRAPGRWPVVDLTALLQ